MKKTIAISLSPNTENDDILLALKILFSPIKWFALSPIKELERVFENYFGQGYHAIAVNSGRSAEYLILKTLGISEKNSVAIQALTCVAVPNPIIWLGAKPIYVDVDDSFNMDIKDLQKKVNKDTKAVIVQHSFGVPANLDKIQQFCKKRHLKLIEDCTVSLGAAYHNKKVGTYGDAAFFSFGRDKIISSVFGGMILTSNNRLYDELIDARDRLDWPKPAWVVQQLLHPVLLKLVIIFYGWGYKKFTIGKILLLLLQRLNILSKAVYPEERYALQPTLFPQKLSGALAILALHQFKKLERFNKKRRDAARMYINELSSEKLYYPPENPGAVWLRMPVVLEKAQELYNFLRSHNVLIGDWYKKVVVPVERLESVKYQSTSCPRAESFSGQMLNFPTNPTLSDEDIRKVITLIKQWLNSNTK